MTGVVHPVPAARSRRVPHAAPRSPLRAAVLALVTLSLYGFWWWWDVNRQLRSLGQPARPWRSLAMVTLGWLVVPVAVVAGRPGAAVVLSAVPVALCLLAVHRTATMIAAAQRRAGTHARLAAPVAVALTAVALGAAVAWFGLSLTGAPVALALGMAWPLVAMVLVGYVQAGLDAALAR
jgi:hypothetical protein